MAWCAPSWYFSRGCPLAYARGCIRDRESIVPLLTRGATSVRKSLGSNCSPDREGGDQLIRLHLCATWRAAQISSGIRLGLVGNLDVVHHLNGSGGLRHPCGCALVLHDAGGTSPSGDLPLHLHLETILTNFRFGEFRFDCGLNLGVAELALTVRLSDGPGKGRQRKEQ